MTVCVWRVCVRGRNGVYLFLVAFNIKLKLVRLQRSCILPDEDVLSVRSQRYGLVARCITFWASILESCSSACRSESSCKVCIRSCRSHGYLMMR